MWGVEPKSKVLYDIDALAGDMGTLTHIGAQDIMSHVPVRRNLAIDTIGFSVCFNMIKIALTLPS